MVKDALASDRIIGMVLLRPGFEAITRAARRSTRSDAPDSSRTRSRSPTGASTSCSGARKVPDDRRRGGKLYRLAHVEALAETVTEEDKTVMHSHRQRLEHLLAAAMEHRGSDAKLSPNVPDDDLVNALAQYLALEPIERQALLECNGVLSRCGALIELLEMRSMMAPGTGSWTAALGPLDPVTPTPGRTVRGRCL